MTGIVRLLNKAKGRKNAHSVFEVFSRANVHFKSEPSKVVRKEGDQFFKYKFWIQKQMCRRLQRALRIDQIAYQTRSFRVGGSLIFQLILVSCPYMQNWDLLSPRAVHFSSCVSEKAIIKNRSSTGTILSPCLTPNLKSTDVSTLPTMSLIILLSYMRLIDECSLGGAPYFPSMAMSSA